MRVSQRPPTAMNTTQTGIMDVNQAASVWNQVTRGDKPGLESDALLLCGGLQMGVAASGFSLTVAYVREMRPCFAPSALTTNRERRRGWCLFVCTREKRLRLNSNTTLNNKLLMSCLQQQSKTCQYQCSVRREHE